MSHIQNDKFIENLHEVAEELIDEQRWTEFEELCHEAKEYGIDLYREYFELIREERQTMRDLHKQQGWSKTLKSHA